MTIIQHRANPNLKDGMRLVPIDGQRKPKEPIVVYLPSQSGLVQLYVHTEDSVDSACLQAYSGTYAFYLVDERDLALIAPTEKDQKLEELAQRVEELEKEREGKPEEP